MPIPGYQDFMLPLLQMAADNEVHEIRTAMAVLARKMEISADEQGAMLRSGKQTRFYNRVTWALTYLTKSLLLEKPSRGCFKITERGKEVLATSPSRIDNAFLERFPEYQAFKTKKAKVATPADTADIGSSDSDPTPDEQIDAAYRELREALADELLTRIRSGTPKFFEQLVVDVLVAMGYGGSLSDAAQVVGKSGDGGIDGVIKEDRLGLDTIYVQAKRHEASIGSGPIREFVGSLGERRATKGVFITSGAFTSGAREAASRAHTRVVLIDGDQLADLMIDHGVGVSDYKSFAVKKLDIDYFEEA